MKRRNYLYVAAALVMAGCSSESEQPLEGGQVALTVNGNIAETTGTRVTYNGAVGTFEAGDAIGVSVTTSGTKTTGTNAKFVTKEGGASAAFVASPDADPIYFLDGKTVSFAAYSPYSTDVTATGELAFSTATQTSSDDQAKFNFLFGTGKGNAASTSGIDIPFEHAMAKLTFTFVAGTGIASTDDFAGNLQAGGDYVVSGLQTEGSFNTLTGTVSSTSDDAASASDKAPFITAAVPDKDATVTTAVTTEPSELIIIPQTPAENTTLTLTLTYKANANSDGIPYVATLKAPADGFVAGNNYTYAVKLNRTGLVVSVVKIKPWEPSNQGNVNAGYEYPDDIYQDEDGSSYPSGWTSGVLEFE
jgi:hypothetical protein